MLQDVRYAFRALLMKSPGFTVVAVLSLALGIGANTAIFTLVRAIFLKPLPVTEPSRLVAVYTVDSKNPGRSFGTSYPNFEDYRDRSTSFSGMFASGLGGVSLSTGAGDAEQIFAESVSGNYFSVLGVEPKPGRAFLPEEDQAPGRNAVTVLSYQLWTRRFGGDRTLIGRTINLNGLPFTVIGIAPQGFRGTSVFGYSDLWIPMMMHATAFPPGSFVDSNFNIRRSLLFVLTGRLKPGVEIGAAQAEMSGIGAQLTREFPDALENRGPKLVPIIEAAVPLRDKLTQFSAFLMIVAGVVLLIACANIANLLLVRGATRRKEIALRVALGSGRGLLIRQLLVESGLLALLGGVAGLLVGAAAKQLLWSMRPPFMERADLDLSTDPSVIAFTLGLVLLTGILFGLAPSLQASRPDLTTELKERVNQTARRGRIGLRDVLVVAQVALSLLSLVGAGLFLTSLRNAESVNPGFDAPHLMVLSVAPGFQGYKQPQALEFYRRMRERVASLPGVAAAGFAEYPSLGGGAGKTIYPEGADLTPGNRGLQGRYESVSVGYLATVQTPLVRGRDFRDSDREDSVQVAIVNETMAARIWPNQSAIGKRFKIFGDQQFREVIGVARTANYGQIGEDPIMFIYIPVEQTYAAAMTLHVRGAGDPAKLLGVVRKEVQSIDPNLPVTNLWTVPQLIDRSLWAAKLGAGMLAAFGLLALALASVGLYGVMAYTVSQRTSEIGVRMALGARSGDVVRLILGQAMVRVGIGLVVGILLAAGLARMVSNLLFGVRALDPVTFTVAGAALAVVAALACVLPALRALRVDPLIALRAE